MSENPRPFATKNSPGSNAKRISLTPTIKKKNVSTKGISPSNASDCARTVRTYILSSEFWSIYGNATGLCRARPTTRNSTKSCALNKITSVKNSAKDFVGPSRPCLQARTLTIGLHGRRNPPFCSRKNCKTQPKKQRTLPGPSTAQLQKGLNTCYTRVTPASAVHKKTAAPVPAPTAHKETEALVPAPTVHKEKNAPHSPQPVYSDGTVPSHSQPAPLQKEFFASTQTDDAPKTPALTDCDDSLHPVQTYFYKYISCAIAP